MAGAEYWIWLQKAMGPASALACRLVAHFGDPEKLYCAGRSEWLASGLLKDAQCEKLCRQSPSESFDVMMTCLAHQLEVVTPDNPHYPKQLLKIPNYPLVLYVQGQTAALNARVMTAIVGTRKSSQGGERFTQRLSADLAREGVVVVSGGALGIDTAAHMGALSQDGVTIVVMGCGLGHEYLMQNEPMRRQAAERGAVISEYLPETPPNKASFPTRNRILAGMSQATVVVEAAEKSGSFITAGDALHMNRLVFAVPAAASGSFYGGTDLLIKEKRAYPANSAADIVKMLRMQNGDWSQDYEAILNAEPPGFVIPKSGESASMPATVSGFVQERFLPKAPQQRKAAPKKEVPPAACTGKVPPEDLQGDLLAVWEALSEGAKSPDELARITGIAPHKVMIAISKLEFKNIVERDFGSVRIK